MFSIDFMFYDMLVKWKKNVKVGGYDYLIFIFVLGVVFVGCGFLSLGYGCLFASDL